MKFILGIIVAILVLGIWFPVVPFPAKKGWHGVNGEFCGIVYTEDCDKTTIKLFTHKGIKDVIQNKAY